MKNETILRVREALGARLVELDVLQVLGSRRSDGALLTPTAEPADSVPRTESGVAVDELTRLRETVDLKLAEIDQTYYEANKVKIGRRVELERQEALKAGHPEIVTEGPSQVTYEKDKDKLRLEERRAQLDAQIQALKEKRAALED